jgi:cytochrome P450
VAHSDFLGWSLFAHHDVVAAVRDMATFSSATKRRAIPNGMDPPEHTAHRQVLDPYFTAERMAAFEPRSRQIAAALLDPLLARGEAEFISEFAGPFPHQALCAFAGWPVADWNRVRGWTHGNQEAAFRHQGMHQTIDVPPGDGALVELTFAEPGTYPFVTHKFSDASKGATGLFKVS